MIKNKISDYTSIECNESVEGETIEEKIDRIVNNQEPITDGAPILYTERKEGVLPQCDPRTDRFEIAIDAMDVVSKTHQAAREERMKGKEPEKPETNGKPESTAGTEQVQKPA